MGSCNPGLKHVRELVVSEQDTSIALGSGDVPVVGTPALLALAESACVQAIDGELADAETTVGTWAEIEHVTPVAVGGRVCARATLIGHHGRRLEFNVTIEHGDTVVAKVRHRRVLVDRMQFLDRLDADRDITGAA
ncbi:MAG: hotdog domain-containing protein, partial [Nitriliruptoraceae bacterium]